MTLSLSAKPDQTFVLTLITSQRLDDIAQHTFSCPFLLEHATIACAEGSGRQMLRLLQVLCAEFISRPSNTAPCDGSF